MVLLVHDSLIPNGVAFDGQGQNLEAARMLVQILHQGRVVFKDVPDVMIDVRRWAFTIQISVIRDFTLGHFRLRRHVNGAIVNSVGIFVGILVIVTSRAWSDRCGSTNQEQSHKVQIVEAHGGDMDGLQAFQTHRRCYTVLHRKKLPLDKVYLWFI